MTKFSKRLTKSTNTEGNVLVVGTGFGYLSDILPLYHSVFVVLNEKPKIKSKNIIYTDSLENLHLLPELNTVFLDLNLKHRLHDFENIMIHCRAMFLVEGNDPLGREWTKSFYKLGYRAVDQQGLFHIWKKIQ